MSAYWNSDDLAVGATIDGLSLESDRDHLDDPRVSHQIGFNSTPSVGIQVDEGRQSRRRDRPRTIAIRLRPAG